MKEHPQKDSLIKFRIADGEFEGVCSNSRPDPSCLPNGILIELLLDSEIEKLVPSNTFRAGLVSCRILNPDGSESSGTCDLTWEDNGWQKLILTTLLD
jgi:hypothetical protein